MEEMRVTYISHSGFLVETEEYAFLFDYFKGNIPCIDGHKKVYVFVSHKHHDHFNKAIFDMVEEYNNIQFILSKDIKMTKGYMERLQIPEQAQEKICYVGKDQTISLEEGLLVETLTSTDEGVAFILRVGDKVIYHAGDLNWWTWIGETKEEYKDMTSRFLKEMKKIEGRSFSIAFLPLDPRQEDRFYLGLDHFMKVTNTKVCVPMHCWDDYSVIERLKQMEESKAYRERIIKIQQEGQVFNIKI